MNQFVFKDKLKFRLSENDFPLFKSRRYNFSSVFNVFQLSHIIFRIFYQKREEIDPGTQIMQAVGGRIPWEIFRQCFFFINIFNILFYTSLKHTL